MFCDVMVDVVRQVDGVGTARNIQAGSASGNVENDALESASQFIFSAWLKCLTQTATRMTRFWSGYTSRELSLHQVYTFNVRVHIHGSLRWKRRLGSVF